MNPLFEEEYRFNQASRPNWDAAKQHRETVTGNLKRLPGAQGGRLCVLGAGNCNDLDLKQLLQVYSEVHLVDLDRSALDYAIEAQGVSGEAAVVCHVGDLTGIGQQLAMLAQDKNSSEAVLDEIRERLSGTTPLELPGPFDVVCSTCILSQLILQVVNAIGETDPRFEELMKAVRAQHYRTVVELITPGGAGFIVSDFVSSESAADLKQVPDFQFTQYLSQLLSSRNFFHGVHPGILLAQLQGNAPLARLVQNVEMLPPWRWDLGARQYAVAGIRFERIPEA
ncbi:hypothetical protein Pan153_25640 [Gimesia panareensis]|uniref:Methyltransferase domain protein n=1 Tax=Gimesia panareensis TaxID=2527978 RepID=A0A518FNI8_9PLAN|nr:hypothetical protein [Gimesia panareensis]QDV17908.1 hypothetical protein Pan153_25640 [Gimesia panareensis]